MIISAAHRIVGSFGHACSPAAKELSSSSVLIHASVFNPLDYPTSDSNKHARVSREVATLVRTNTTL